MIDRKELLELQKKVRARGEICNFFLDKNGFLDQVAYRGRIWSLLSFAEKEREICVDYHKI